MWVATVYYTEWNQRSWLFPRTLMWCLLDNERSDCALVVKDVNLMFTWQRAKRLCARCQRRWFDIYLTTSEVDLRTFPRTLIWCLLDNERSRSELVSRSGAYLYLTTSEVDLRPFPRTWFDAYLTTSEVDLRSFLWVELIFTWQRAKKICVRFQGRWFDVYMTTSERLCARYQGRWFDAPNICLQ